MKTARVWRWVAGTLAGVLIALALLLGALRLALKLTPDYADRLQAWVQQQTQLRLEFARLDARLRWFGPEIVLHDARVIDEDGSQALFAAREGAVGLDLLNFFRTGQLVAGRLRFVEPDLTVVRLADGRFRLLGLRERPAQRPVFDLDRLPAGVVEISGARLRYRDLATGRGPWTLSDIDLRLRRDRDDVEAYATGRLPRSIGGELRLEARLNGSLQHRERLDARIDLHLDELRLGGLAPLLPDGGPRPLAGAGRLRAVTVLERGELRQLRLVLDLAGVEFALPAHTLPPLEAVRVSAPYRPPGAAPLSLPVVDIAVAPQPAAPLPAAVRYARLGGDYRLRREGDAWRLVARDVELLRSAARGGGAGPARIDATWQGHPRSRFATQLEVERLRLEEVWPLVAAVPGERLSRLLPLAPQGEIRRLRLALRRERAGSEPQFEVAADVAGVGVRPTQRWPGLSGLTLSLSGDERAGRIALRARDPAFDWPLRFRAPIAAREASGDFTWRRDGRAWVVSGGPWRIEHEHASGSGSLEFRFERPGVSPFLKLEATVERVDAAIVPSVLPVGRMKGSSVAWLDRALVAGAARNGRLSYAGPVRKFPFRHGEGEFRAQFEASDVVLDYADGFAPLTGATAQVAFHNASIAASGSGRLGTLEVARARFGIADYKTPVIEVDGQATGDLGRALDYLQRSPLGPQLGEQFMGLRGRGAASFDVGLRLPTADPQARDYTVRTRVDGAQLDVPVLREPLRRLSGTLEIHNYEARARGLKGSLFDGPFEADVEPGRAGPGVSAVVNVRARGRANGARLPAYLGLPGGVGATGSFDWTLAGRMQRLGPREPWPGSAEITTDLAGLAIAAPMPFAKPAAEPRRTRVRLAFDAPRRVAVDVESGSARAALAFAPQGARWGIERGAVRFDGQPVSVPARPGLQVAGDWPDFDLGEWLALRPAAGGSRRTLAELLGPIDVQLAHASVLGFEFSAVAARLQDAGSAWRIDVESPQAQGRVIVPHVVTGAEPIVLELQTLALSSSARTRAGENAARTADPREVPALRANVADFSWDNRRFGRLQADVRRVAEGLELVSLRTTSDAFTLQGTGRWLMRPGGSRTQLELGFASTDLAAASRALGYRDAVAAERAAVTAGLEWSGGPSADAIGRLNGTVRLELDRGQLRAVKPGAGRILGLLSVSALPRRLTLDFRDVTEEGLAFDTVRGDFEVRDGSAYTDDLLVRGAAVDLGVVGRTGLAAQDYDQTIVVSGNPSGPLTVAGALAGGPVGAAGAMLLSQLFKGQLQGLTRSYYRVTGSWAAPVVTRIGTPSSDALAEGAPAPPGSG